MHSCMCAGRVASNLLISPPSEGASGKEHALGQTLKEKPVSLEIRATNQSNTSYEEPRRYTTGVECRDWGRVECSSAPLHSDCSNLD